MSSNIDDSEDSDTLVIDAGSGILKAGFAGDDAPRVVYQNLVGRPKLMVNMKEMTGCRNVFIGEIAEQERSILKLTYPMERGIVKNWDDMQEVWHYTFYDALRVDPEESPVLLTEPPLNPKSNREKTAELMFETFNAKGLSFSLQPTLSLYASGRHCGLVAEVGDGITSITAMKGVYRWSHTDTRFHLGGRDLTNYLAKLLSDRGYYFHTSSEMEIVREMKEKLGYVAVDYNEEQSKYASSTDKEKESTFKLPDGQTITVGDEKFRCTEPLFDPSLLGMEHAGISELIYKTIMSIDIHARADIYCNIIVTGASTCFPGFPERVEKEMRKLAPPTMKVKVVAQDERKYNSWIGASILGSLSSFKNLIISRQEFQEHGPAIVHRCVS